MTNQERWVPAYQWENLYEVSDLGRIRSIERTGKTQFGVRKYGGGIVNPIKHKANGYLVVNLTSSGGRRKQVLVHRLVIMSFLGTSPKGMECCHNNGDRQDPRLVNLRWDTRKNNHADKKIHGTWQGGENNGWHKLTVPQVIAIRTSGLSIKELSEKFSVSTSCIEQVKYFQSWKHVVVKNV
ncbi:NUMOD4 motif-containing HNH endonuclease [Morganella morganii]|uniref:NUMOD4 motif-containing HNH endonuclease n=1 Tax=Morganella morganii TaxID=582 RepID=UPI0016464000|nr:NUMOD4 motif-containing HNH endonuclease [Morganella morganii]MBC3977929.1 HNH endonuclease [Morganella morganii]HDU8695027.1 NUMOD4 motif-containing HNH endonuclease [Morganella morganii subsp. morganii]